MVRLNELDILIVMLKHKRHFIKKNPLYKDVMIKPLA